MNNLPKWALALDTVGAVMLGLGLYGKFASGDSLLFAESIDPRGNAVLLMVIGGALMLPLIGIFIGRISNRKLDGQG